MRRFRAIAFATALEILSEPFCFLLTLSALVLVSLAPALHYHQFGEPSRMARDAGFSAVLLGGFLYAAFGAFKTYRREVESGTMGTALAHSISRTHFFLAKFAGCLLANLVFDLTVGSVSLTIVNGAEIGGLVAAAKCDIARLWGPSLAIALAAVVVPVSGAAAANRFFRCRFILTANLLALLLAMGGVAYRFDAVLAARIIPATVLFAMPSLVLASAVSAFSVRFKPNFATALIVISVGALIPAIGNYCLSDALAGGGAIPLSYFLLALSAIAPAVMAFLALGVAFVNGRDAI